MYFAIALTVSAVLSYLAGGVNGAILMSRLLHHEDIRKKGSGNPGFTNYKRVYGGGFATWIVMAFDLIKTAVPVFLSALLFRIFREEIDFSVIGLEDGYAVFQFGAAFSGFFCMIGHAFPAWFGFRGGKAFLCGAATVWFVDWHMAVIATVVFLFFLFVVRFMSLASILGALTCPLVLLAFSPPLAVEILTAASAALIILRHYKNIVRLLRGQETQFRLF